jgi:hypothetical protein
VKVVCGRKRDKKATILFRTEKYSEKEETLVQISYFKCEKEKEKKTTVFQRP